MKTKLPCPNTQETTPAPAPPSEPVILYDSGSVSPSLSTWVYVKDTKTGVLFARNTFEAATTVTVFLKQLTDLVDAPLVRSSSSTAFE